MGAEGIREFVKWYYGVIRKEGLVVDDRWNGGGNVSQMVIERLRRTMTGTGYSRNSEYTDTYPGTVFVGPMACLLNENSASDGDIFPWMFREAKLGPLIGKRSWGGVVGITNHGPLIDGAASTSPSSATPTRRGSGPSRATASIPTSWSRTICLADRRPRPAARARGRGSDRKALAAAKPGSRRGRRRRSRRSMRYGPRPSAPLRSDRAPPIMPRHVQPAQEAAPSGSRSHLCGAAGLARSRSRLLQRLLQEARSTAAAIAWRYDRSPHGSSVSFLSLPPDGEGVCGYACSPRTALRRATSRRRASLGETGDVMTHPDWRKKGLFSALDRACMAETKRLGWPAVFGLPNRRSAHIFLELGWKKVGTCGRGRSSEGRRRARARAPREGRLRAGSSPLGVRKGEAARAKLVERAGSGFQARALDRFPPRSRTSRARSRSASRSWSAATRRGSTGASSEPSGLHRALGVFGRDRALRRLRVVQLPRRASPAVARRRARARRRRARGGDLGRPRATRARGRAVVQAPRRRRLVVVRALQEAGFLPPKASNHLIVIAWQNDPRTRSRRRARRARLVPDRRRPATTKTVGRREAPDQALPAPTLARALLFHTGLAARSSTALMPRA
jgi:GNAT superfamily N-acetyltransferase